MRLAGRVPFHEIESQRPRGSQAMTRPVPPRNPALPLRAPNCCRQLADLPLRQAHGPPRKPLAESVPVMALACSINGPKGLWLRKEVRRVEDLKGLRLRVGGTTALSLQSAGIASQQLSAGDIYPALERGTIDGLEWFTPPMDEKLGWHKVAKHYYYPFGEPTFSTVSDLLINRRVWDELDSSFKSLFESVCQRQLRDDFSKLTDGVTGSLGRFKAGGTSVAPVPDAIFSAYRQGAEAYLDQNVRSPAGLAAWRSLK